MTNGETVKDSLVALIAKMGEKITIGRAKTFNNSGSKNFNYLHTVVKDNFLNFLLLCHLKLKMIQIKSKLLENNWQCTLQHLIP